MFEVYKDKIKELIEKIYLPGETGIGNHDLKLTTYEVAFQVKTVIPANYVDEATIYECLEELGYTPKYETKQNIVEIEIECKTDLEGKPLTKTDIVDYNDLTYFWYFKKREND